MAFLIFLIQITILIFTPEGALITINKETNSNDESQLNPKLVYVGDMYIEDTVNYETSIATATSEKDMKIGIGQNGSDVILHAKYLLQCL